MIIKTSIHPLFKCCRMISFSFQLFNLCAMSASIYSYLFIIELPQCQNLIVICCCCLALCCIGRYIMWFSIATVAVIAVVVVVLIVVVSAQIHTPIAIVCEIVGNADMINSLREWETEGVTLQMKKLTQTHTHTCRVRMHFVLICYDMTDSMRCN